MTTTQALTRCTGRRGLRGAICRAKMMQTAFERLTARIFQKGKADERGCSRTIWFSSGWEQWLQFLWKNRKRI